MLLGIMMAAGKTIWTPRAIVLSLSLFLSQLFELKISTRRRGGGRVQASILATQSARLSQQQQQKSQRRRRSRLRRQDKVGKKQQHLLWAWQIVKVKKGSNLITTAGTPYPESIPFFDRQLNRQLNLSTPLSLSPLRHCVFCVNSFDGASIYFFFCFSFFFCARFN